jgi:quercetin dioxygenase-like cupin family protein
MLGVSLLVVGVAGSILLYPPVDGSAASTLQDRAVIQGRMEDLDLGNLTIRRFRFAAGARLGWHTHLDGPQVLMMEDARGRMQERGGPVIELLPNVPIATPAGVEHWHGAAPDEAGVQWNIYDGIGVPGSVWWGDSVTTAEYTAAVGRSGG